ncbi:hypothetical protein AGMMS4952_02360 [Spirochaetia bacterium]|nr:hypothetical protein AGMMS4952_02360 [Spirochaetia bacterium]
MISVAVQFAASAFKHHYTETDIHHVLLHPVYDEIQDKGGDKHLLIGFDRNMNLVEIVYNIIDEQVYKVFHADKCQKRHLALLKR